MAKLERSRCVTVRLNAELFPVTQSEAALSREHDLRPLAVDANTPPEILARAGECDTLFVVSTALPCHLRSLQFPRAVQTRSVSPEDLVFERIVAKDIATIAYGAHRMACDPLQLPRNGTVRSSTGAVVSKVVPNTSQDHHGKRQEQPHAKRIQTPRPARLLRTIAVAETFFGPSTRVATMRNHG